jgi:hypothetical protein
MNDDDSRDGVAWNERVTTAVNWAAEHIHALPIELRSRALAMLAVSFDRELKPLLTGRWKSFNRSRSFARQGEGR